MHPLQGLNGTSFKNNLKVLILPWKAHKVCGIELLPDEAAHNVLVHDRQRLGAITSANFEKNCNRVYVFQKRTVRV